MRVPLPDVLQYCNSFETRKKRRSDKNEKLMRTTISKTKNKAGRRKFFIVIRKWKFWLRTENTAMFNGHKPFLFEIQGLFTCKERVILVTCEKLWCSVRLSALQPSITNQSYDSIHDLENMLGQLSKSGPGYCSSDQIFKIE